MSENDVDLTNYLETYLGAIQTTLDDALDNALKKLQKIINFE